MDIYLKNVHIPALENISKDYTKRKEELPI